jgi:hypothetical protein
MADAQRQAPATFSIEGNDAPVGSAATPQLGVPFMQPQGTSPGIANQQPDPNGDVNAKTFRAITELASGTLAPKIKEAAQGQFISGVQRAMTGEALNEIIKDQPWYSDIFAPSSALAGARTYTAQAAVAQWAGKIQEQMPQLAKVGPEQLQSAAVGALQGFLTGDPASDAMVTSHVAEQMAPLFKQQAKEHYVYMQKQASMAQLQAWDAAGKVYNNLAATEASGTGTVSPEDKEAAKSRFLGSIVPFADQSDEAYHRSIQSFLEGAAAAGNFHVIRLFKDTGLYDKLDSDKRADLDRTIKRFARDTLDQNIPKFALDIASLVNDPTQDPREIPAKVQALNEKAAKITGVTEASLVPPQSVDNLVGKVMVEQRHAADTAAAKAEAQRQKEQGQLDKVALAGTLIQKGPGVVDAAIAMNAADASDVEVAGLTLFNAAKRPSDAATILNSRLEGPFKTVKSRFDRIIQAEEYNDGGVGRMAQIYAGLAENVKPHYFDPQQRKQLDLFTSEVSMGMPPQAAWVSSKFSPSVTGDQLSDDPKDVVSKAIRDEVDSYAKNRFIGIPIPFSSTVDDSGKRMIESVMRTSMKVDRGNNPLPVAAKRGLAQAIAAGIDIQGDHVIFNTAPGVNPPLFRVVGESQIGTAEALGKLMEEKAKAMNSTLDNYEAFRVKDVGGKAFIYMRGTDSDGKSAVWTINSDEIKEAVTKKVRRDKFLAQPVTPQQRYEPSDGGAPPIPGLQ